MNRQTRMSLIKVVIYTIASLASTVLLVLVIVNARSGETTRYEADFTDASGVQSSDNVKIAGVVVGRVSDVRVLRNGTARVGFNVKKDVALPTDVRIQIRYQNLIGDRYLDLQRSEQTGTTLDAGSVIPLSRTEPALNLTVLFNGFRPLFQALQPEQVNQLSEEIVSTLQGEGGTVESLLARTASLTSTIADRDEVIGSLITDLNGVLGTVAERDDQLSSLVVELQRFVSGLSEDREAIGEAVDSVGELGTTVGGLVQEARPPLKDDIAALGEVSQNLRNDSEVLDRQLTAIPQLLGRVNRTASYGSWFQFYLCGLGGSLQNGSDRAQIPLVQYPPERCGA